MCLQCGRPVFDPWVGKIHWRRKWKPTSVFLPGKSHGQRSLGCYIVHGVAKSPGNMTKWLIFSLAHVISVLPATLWKWSLPTEWSQAWLLIVLLSDKGKKGTLTWVSWKPYGTSLCLKLYTWGDLKHSATFALWLEQTDPKSQLRDLFSIPVEQPRDSVRGLSLR